MLTRLGECVVNTMNAAPLQCGSLGADDERDRDWSVECALATDLIDERCSAECANGVLIKKP